MDKKYSSKKDCHLSLNIIEFRPLIKIDKRKKLSPFNLFFLKIMLVYILIVFIIFKVLQIKKKINEQSEIRNISEDKNIKEIHIDENYNKIETKEKNLVYIPIVATNDIHGNFFPVENVLNYNNKKIKYKTGGLEYISKYINILKDEFGKDRVLYLDSGDNYFESYKAQYFDGTIIQDFFHLIGLNATTLGNHEFLYQKEWVEKKIKNAKYPILLNNLEDKKTKKKNGILGKNQKTSHLFEIKLENEDIIKIGVIGLTLNIPTDKTFYDVGERYTWNDFEFQDYYIDLEEEAQKLRNNGANAIIIIAHVGLKCPNHEDTLKLKMYTHDTEQSKCDLNSPIVKLINKTKPGVIDGIIIGDMHNEVHHWINNIAIMGTNGGSKNLNIMYLPFKKDNNSKYILQNKEIKIEGPLPACEKIFSNTRNCEKIKKNEKYFHPGELVNFYWHNKKIETDPIVKPIYKKYFLKYKKYFEDILFEFKGFNNGIKVNDSGDSIIERLFLDIIKNISNTDFSIVHKSMFSKFLHYVHPGNYTYEDYMKIIPYSGKLCVTEVSGEELITIIKNAQIGKYIFQPTSGLRQTIKINDSGKNEVINVEIYENGEVVPINRNKIYKMSSSSIIFSEASFDDFASKEVLDIIKDKLKNKKIKCSNNELNLEILNYLQNKKIIDVNKEVNNLYQRIVLQ